MLRNWCFQCIRIALTFIVVFATFGLIVTTSSKALNIAAAQSGGSGAPNAIHEDSTAYKGTFFNNLVIDEEGKILFYEQGGPSPVIRHTQTVPVEPPKGIPTKSAADCEIASVCLAPPAQASLLVL